MKYCSECGTELTKKTCGDEGEVPFCPDCNAVRFELFSMCVLVVLFNPDKTKICILRQNYVHKEYGVLIAGYVKNTETLEQTVAREVFEETGLIVEQMQYMRSVYHPKSRALMAEFWATSTHENFNIISSEVDEAKWVDVPDALSCLRPNSTGALHLQNVLQKNKK